MILYGRSNIGDCDNVGILIYPPGQSLKGGGPVVVKHLSTAKSNMIQKWVYHRKHDFFQWDMTFDEQTCGINEHKKGDIIEPRNDGCSMLINATGIAKHHWLLIYCSIIQLLSDKVVFRQWFGNYSNEKDGEWHHGSLKMCTIVTFIYFYTEIAQTCTSVNQLGV